MLTPRTWRCSVLALLVLTLSGPAAEKGAVKVEKVAYGGWKNNLLISNGEAELIVTLDVGPRILSYQLAGGRNVFKEYKDQLGKSGEKGWQIRGGHRLWAAPEDTTRTYAPDNGPVKYEIQEATGSVRVTQPTDAYGIQKEMEIRLAPKGSEVTVMHRLKNCGSEATKLAPWALSVMDAGGIEYIPLPPKKPHPGSVTPTTKPSDYWPNQTLIFWPFFDFADPRWNFGSKYITLRQAKRGPTKIGVNHREGWVAYLNRGTLFVKGVSFEEGKHYPDRGSNFETFSNEDMLEVETLGPLVSLAPGETVEHLERWRLFKDVAEPKNEDEIDKIILSKVKTK